MNVKLFCTESDSHAFHLERASRSLCCPLLNRYVSLTQTEYRLCEVLFQERLLSDERLVRHVFACSLDTQMKECLDKHIDHLRSKLRVYAWTIYRVLCYGYLLLPRDQAHTNDGARNDFSCEHSDGESGKRCFLLMRMRGRILVR
jgi:hypothetical protein